MKMAQSNLWDNTRLVLNTRGRVDSQHTLNNLTDTIRKQITIVCFPGERESHLKKWGDKVYEIIEHPTNFKYLSEIRHWVLESFRDDYVILMDDNLNFHSRILADKNGGTKYGLNPLSEMHYYTSTIESIQIQMFEWMIQRMKDGYSVAGISQRSWNNLHPEEEENFRFYALYGVNKHLYKKVNPTLYRKCINKEDFCLGLEFLTAGIPNIVSYKFAFGKVGSANNKGGCSTYRTLKNSNEGSIRLKKEFPGFVKIQKKSTKSWGGDFKDYAYDVIIQWKKAYKYGLQRGKGLFPK